MISEYSAMPNKIFNEIFCVILYLFLKSANTEGTINLEYTEGNNAKFS